MPASRLPASVAVAASASGVFRVNMGTFRGTSRIDSTTGVRTFMRCRHGGQLRKLHRWFAPPLQSQRMVLVPLAVPAPLASRHRPDWTPEMVPLALTFHCWLG